MTFKEPDHISKEKRRLLDLEASGKYVFHGSGSDIEVFEPRQAYNFIDGKNHPDGKPAIFASSVADYAIFMAIINGANCSGEFHSSAGTVNGTITFRATADTMGQLKDDASGWVYVFNKEQFSRRSEKGIEYVSHVSVKPVGTVRVTKEDLPQAVEIME